MADKKFTLLELHLDDGSIQLGPATLGAEDDELPEPDAEAADEADGGGCCPGRKAGKLLVALLVLAVLALGLKKLLGGSEDLAELEDLADLDEEA